MRALLRRLPTRPLLALFLAAALGAAASAGTVVQPPKSADLVRGKKLFRVNCGPCHRLAAAGTRGGVGPNLTWERIEYSLGVWTINNGTSLMPAFKGRLTRTEIRDLAAYLAKVTT
jgi:mono/diheme cytochrome c family protein